MPELPEVETVVRTVTPYLLGRRILHVWLAPSRVVIGDPARLAQRLEGRLILGVRRLAKNILIDLDDGAVAAVHLGMTGKLMASPVRDPYTRAVFELDAGVLQFNDVRQFGRLEVAEGLPARIAALGPEPLEIAEAEFLARLETRRGRLKALLLDQAFVGGIGNIYADEILFESRIHPLAQAARLSAARGRRLYAAMRRVLAAAIETGGSSISNYVDAEGRAGFFQIQHQVYQKTGQPCPACGAPIRRILVAQRGTHYCPRCQRP